MLSKYFLILNIVCLVYSQQTADIDLLINSCIDSKHHKSKPGPEGLLYGQCTPWKDRSCCMLNTTEKIHLTDGSLYNFNYDHCAEKKKMSDDCKRHFIQDHCFYECSPNVGPWTVKEQRSWRKERYYKVPLCASDCDSWFKDCQNDYTCTDNWSKNFDWVKTDDCKVGANCKINKCPAGAKCQTFLQIYNTPENFCQRVWDDAWEYTSGNPCMRIWFNESGGNPNDGVAVWKAKQLVVSASETVQRSAVHLCFIFTSLLISTVIIHHAL